MIRLTKSGLCSLFMVILLATEFYYIEVFGGALRLYHLLAPIVILFFHRFIWRTANSGVFWALTAFLVANILAAALAQDPVAAFKSLSLLTANMSIAIAVALILISGRLRLEQIIHISLAVAIAGIVLGIVQVAGLNLAGLNLALSPTQEAQIALGFGSGFRTEANTFAKYLNTVFLLVLPMLLADKNGRRALLIFTILLIGMLSSLTRSALYGLFIVFIIIYIRHLSRGRRSLISSRPVFATILILGTLSIFATVVIYYNPYAAHKITSFFDPQEIMGGGSSSFRLMSQGVLWDAFLATDKTILFGNGWGQVTFSYIGIEWQAGGAEIALALSYGGIFGGLFYLLYQLTAINSVRRVVGANPNDETTHFREGVMFALIGLLVTGQINGALIAPEYWMVFGMAIAITASGGGSRVKKTPRNSAKNRGPRTDITAPCKPVTPIILQT